MTKYCCRTWFLLFGFVFCPPVSATDYFFRPASLAMAGAWTSNLEFIVSNPSRYPVVLEISTKEVGVLLAAEGQTRSVLRALPASLVVRPGEVHRVELEVDDARNLKSPSSFEITVEQLPILYVNPGEARVPDIMTVTRYTASVAVRVREPENQYAMTTINRARKQATAIEAGDQFQE